MGTIVLFIALITEIKFAASLRSPPRGYQPYEFHRSAAHLAVSCELDQCLGAKSRWAGSGSACHD